MKAKLLDMVKKLKNAKTLTAVISAIVLLLTTWGVALPVENIETTVQIVCTLGILLGVFNKDGMDTMKWNK